MVAVGAVSDEQQPRVDAAADELPQHLDDEVGALDGGHPADPADDERVTGEAEHTARLGAASRIAADALVELDAEADHCELRRRCDVQADEVVAHLRTDGDETGRGVREQPFECPEAKRGDAVEIPPQHMAVERVDHDRDPGQASREATGRASLRHMCVDNVRPALPNQAVHGQRGAEVVERTHLTPKLAVFAWANSMPRGEIAHRSFMGPFEPRHQDR